MVDAIGLRGVSSGDRVAATNRVVTPTAPVAPAPAVQAAAETSVGSLAQAAAATPPVREDRVAEIKKAVADGTFPISPAKIADRLIALRYDWLAND